MLTQERMFHYSLLGDSNVEGSFYFFEEEGGGGGVKYKRCFQNKKKRWTWAGLLKAG